jgi:hypothetical protein
VCGGGGMVGDLLWDCPVERGNSRCARLGQVVADVAWMVGERVVVSGMGVTHSRTVRWRNFVSIRQPDQAGMKRARDSL